MHKSSYEEMKRFRDTYILPGTYLRVLDVGSIDVNGSYRELFREWEYTGLDLTPGPNVDVVAKNPYHWPLIGHSFDVLVSGQCMEHVKDLHAWVTQCSLMLKPGGLICLIAPWKFKQHRYPVDCWRILPDGMAYLLGEIAGFSIEKCYISDVNTIGIGRKLCTSR